MNTEISYKESEFDFTETMWGYVALGADDFKEGYEIGKKEGNKLEYRVTIHVEDFENFKSKRKAPMTGWITCKNLFGEKIALYNGEFGLYSEDPETHEKRISYQFNFKSMSGNEYRFSGYKVIVHDPWTFDVLEDHTTLFATIYEMDGGKKKPTKGIIHYHPLEDFLQMLMSICTPKNDTHFNRMWMALKFLSFVFKEIGSEYLSLKPLYKAEYRNLVCRGICSADSKEDREFFFFSGKHDKGFPWGDNVGFDDVALLLRDGKTWRRFALSDHTISNLELPLFNGTNKDKGKYLFQGHLFEVTNGYQVSFKEMYQDPLPAHLRKVNVSISLSFKQKLIKSKNIPFEWNLNGLQTSLEDMPKKDKEGLSKIWESIKEWFLKWQMKRSMEKRLRDIKASLKSFKDWGLDWLGYHTKIHRLTDFEGSFTLDGITYSLHKGKPLGEGEHGKLVLLKKPLTYYNYFCAIDKNETDSFRVHVRSGVLRSLSRDFLSSWFEDFLGRIVGQIARMDFLVKGEEGKDIESEDEADALIMPGEDLLEINNDHYPHRIFQRRVVTLPSTSGFEKEAIALEEDMSVINLEPYNNKTDKIAHVAVIKSPNRFDALDKVLKETGFFELLDEAQKNSGKNKGDFSIIIKPNFSFMYSLTDLSTFTDPHLVEHLVDRIYEKGYRNITIAEAQSTYSAFFTNRDVPTLATYIGFRDKATYKIVDLSEKDPEFHPVWKNTDFRISFAKNKTHSYAFYSLTIKNIYGALPRKNKFKEYHCNKEEFGEYPIYTPTIDFIEKYPVHFGFIDAYFSADGKFGVFADKEPNYTSTIIGGDDLVAVDWVGASKMGLDPMISKYMELAVERFGKPSIKLIGDHSLYSSWRNVPPVVTKVALLIDRDYTIGSKFYAIFASMDPLFTFKVDDPNLRVLRLLSTPIRKIFFEWVRGERKELSWHNVHQMLKQNQLEKVKNLLDLLREKK